MKKSVTFFCLALIFLPSYLEASEVKINGFFARGIIQADGSNFVSDDGGISANLTEIGLNSSYRFNANFRLAGQAVYLNGGNRYPEAIRLDYLFWEWQPLNTKSGRLGPFRAK